MCGIAGFWTPGGFELAGAKRRLAAMTEAIRSRGPDAAGTWTDAAQGIALGHRRLSILELSEAGAQPMTADSGRYVLIFNGEIYNHLDMRRALPDAAPWRGHSDTETLLRAIDRHGIAGALEQAVGMFALAVWDRQDGVLTLARDRMGEKPLYFGWQGTGSERSFLFGSELKALTAHPSFDRNIDRRAVAGYLDRLCVPGDASVWQGIAKVPAGAIVRLKADGTATETRYWQLSSVIAAGARAPVVDPREAVELTHDRLHAAVAAQLISDVPLGAFLSGGVDSSLIVALMQEVTGGGVQTFSIGFEQAAYNEADHARAVAAHLGTRHHELIVSPQRAQAVIPLLPAIYDEPFADSSQIPTYLVAEMARGGVTVALSGDGADELFGGYTRYEKALRAWQRIAAVPAPLRKAIGALTTPFDRIIPRKVARAVRVAAAPDLARFYAAFTRHSDGPLAGPALAPVPLAPSMLTGAESLMAADQAGYLVDDILVKVDRAAMAVSLETRAPFLDHRVVAESWRIAAPIKRRAEGNRMVGKWPLRQVLDRYVPRDLIERPKQGFAVPIGSWLRGPLRDWADDLLTPDALASMDLLDVRGARAVWEAHRSGQADLAEQVWALAMLSAWHREQHRAAAAPELPAA
jgi:asparagine synthase (glutamine-hydrolysing)